MGSRASGVSSRLESIRGSVPDPYSLPKGCPFHPRCKDAIRDVCDVQDPPVIEVGVGHSVRCHLYTEKPATAAVEQASEPAALSSP
jgi:peptide/nickel transport system ATP-binding protein